MSDPARDDVVEALLGFKRKHSQFAMRQLLETVAGVAAISDIPEEKFDAVIEACGKEPAKSDDADDFEGGESPKTIGEIEARAWSKWNDPFKRER